MDQRTINSRHQGGGENGGLNEKSMAVRGDFDALLKKRVDSPGLPPRPVPLKGLDLKRMSSSDIPQSSTPAADGYDSGGSFETARETAFSPSSSTVSVADSRELLEAVLHHPQSDPEQQDGEEKGRRTGSLEEAEAGGPSGRVPGDPLLVPTEGPAENGVPAGAEVGPRRSVGGDPGPPLGLDSQTVVHGTEKSANPEFMDGKDSNPGLEGEPEAAQPANQPPSSSASNGILASHIDPRGLTTEGSTTREVSSSSHGASSTLPTPPQEPSFIAAVLVPATLTPLPGDQDEGIPHDAAVPPERPGTRGSSTPTAGEYELHGGNAPEEERVVEAQIRRHEGGPGLREVEDGNGVVEVGELTGGGAEFVEFRGTQDPGAVQFRGVPLEQGLGGREDPAEVGDPGLPSQADAAGASGLPSEPATSRESGLPSAGSGARESGLASQTATPNEGFRLPSQTATSSDYGVPSQPAFQGDFGLPKTESRLGDSGLVTQRTSPRALSAASAATGPPDSGLPAAAGPTGGPGPLGDHGVTAASPRMTEDDLFSPFEGSIGMRSSGESGTLSERLGGTAPPEPADGRAGPSGEAPAEETLDAATSNLARAPSGTSLLSEAILRTARGVAAVERELQIALSGNGRDASVGAAVQPGPALRDRGAAGAAVPQAVAGSTSGSVPAGRGRADLADGGQAGAEAVGSNENSQSWRQQRKHIFVLSNAGKPVFTLHGDDNALAGFMAVIDAIISFVKDKGDTLHHVRAGRHLFVFVQRGPLYLVAVSATGEPPSVLEKQLSLVHAQIVCILTNHFDRMLAKNPRFDSRRLLGGTQEVLRALIQSFEWDPSALVGGFLPLPLRSSLRHTALLALQAAVKASGALYGVLLAGNGVVALSQPRAHPLHIHDLLLLCSFVRGTTSFRQPGTESFSPVCLPHFNAAAFLHAYVRYLHMEAGLVVALLSSKPDDFYELSSAAAKLERDLQGHGIIRGVVEAVVGKEGRGLLRIPDLPPLVGGGSVGETALLHFVYKAPTRSQLLMPAYTAPLDRPELLQAVMPQYACVRALLFREDVQSPGRVHFLRNDRLTTLAYVSPEYEIYAQYDALVDKEAATGICNRLAAWIKQHQADLFVPL